VFRRTEWGGMKLNMDVAGGRKYMSAVMEIVLHGLISREESVCSNAITFVGSGPAQCSAAQVSPKRSKVHRRAPPKGMQRYRTLECGQPSPALRFVMLCLLGSSLLRPMIVVQRARRGRKGRKGCTLERSALGACEPELACGPWPYIRCFR